VKLSHLIAQSAQVTLTYGAESVQLTVRPQAMTTEMLELFGQLENTVTNAAELSVQMQSIREIFLALVSGWDLQDDNGDVLLVSPVGLPLKFLMDSIRAALSSVGEGSAPAAETGKLNGATSGATSSLKAS
jgi:hypothetical protein